MKAINGKNWTETVDKKELNVDVYAMGSRHVPIKHGDILDLFKSKIHSNHITINKEVGYLSPDKKKFMYVTDITAKNHNPKDYTFSLGFLNFNDEKRAFTPIYGEKVFVCSNQMIRSDNENTRVRHIGNIHYKIDNLLDQSFYKAFDFMDKRTNEIDKMKQMEISQEAFNSYICRFVKNEAFNNSFLSDFIKEWENPVYDDFSDKNLWSFQNCFTETLKKVNNPIQRVSMSNTMNGFIKSLV